MMASPKRLLTLLIACAVWAVSDVSSASTIAGTAGIPYERFLSRSSVPELQGAAATLRTFTHTRTDQLGRFVTFHSDSSFLVPGDLNGQPDVFLRDRLDDSIELLSRDTDGDAAGADSSFPDISSDGRYVVFHSRAGDLVDGDDNDDWDVFLLDREDDEMTLVSRAPDGDPGDDQSFTPTVSDDGRYVAFTSWADNLTDDPAEDVARIYVADLVDDTVTMLVSPPEGGFGYSSFVPDISGDGRYVTFESKSDRIVAADSNDTWDVFTVDRGSADLQDESASTSVTLVSSGAGNSVGSFRPRISTDGQWIAFESYSDSLSVGDTNGVVDVFRWGRGTGDLTRISNSDPSGAIDAGATAASISDDGSFIAFQTDSDHEVSGDDNGERDTYVVDLSTGDITWSSDPAKTGAATNDPSHPSIAGDGSVIAFESRTPKGHPGEDDDDWDPYIVDLAAGVVANVADPDGPRSAVDAFVFGTSGSTRFDDVDPFDYQDRGIGFLARNGISFGVAPGVFAPDQPLTRGQLAALLYRLSGCQPGSPVAEFVDVPVVSWYSRSIAWLARSSVTTGVGGNRFGPEEPATRAQMMVMLYRLAGRAGDNVPPGPFMDVDRDGWYAASVDWAYAIGVTTGVSSERFAPAEPVTRGQAATLIERFARVSGWVPTT